MAYLTINNYSSYGKMCISTEAITSIVMRVVKDIDGVHIASDKGGLKSILQSLFELKGGVQTNLVNGKAVIRMDLILSKNCEVREVCLRIQGKVIEALHIACEGLPCEVRIRVVDLK